MTRSYPSTIAAAVEHETVVRKSRFLTRVVPVAGTREADEVIAEARRRGRDANHHCSAMVTGVLADQARSSDDGEPSGTAGVPMLEVLRRRDLTDLVAVVTRWFGGVELGAGGLVRAYSSATSEALDRAALVPRASRRQVTLDVPHAEAGRLEHVLREWVRHHDATLGPVTYGQHASFELWVPDPGIDRLRADLAAESAGALRPVLGEERVVDLSTR